MSRIGKQPIELPQGVKLAFADQMVTVKGPKGELRQPIEVGFGLAQEGSVVTLTRPTEQKRHRALHGLYRSLINNMATGVSTGLEKQLELVGVGYRAEVRGQVIEFQLGYSHPIILMLPAEITAKTEIVKGANPKLILTGIDKQLIGQIAAKIRSLRAPEPYKGKGIRFVGEQVRRKAGKSAGKGKK